MGVFTLVGGIIGTFIQPNMERLIDDVRQGTLDYVLTKPDDAQVLVSVREIRIWQLVDVVARDRDPGRSPPREIPGTARRDRDGGVPRRAPARGPR